MDAPRHDREKAALRLAVLHAEIEGLRPRLREGHVPTAFRDMLGPLAEAIALCEALDLGEEAARFEAIRAEARKIALVALGMVAARAEGAVGRMYEPSGGAGAYAEAKDLFGDAIGLAKRLGLDADARKLEARLAEVKAVFRGQIG
jgi:hypothetical protein